MIPAHGISTGVEVATPSTVVAYGAFVVVSATAVVLRRWWREPALADVAGGRPLVPWPSPLVAAAWLVGCATFVVVVLAALLGPETDAPNLAPYAVYVVLWVVLPAVTAVVGDVWRGLAPWAPRWWRGHEDRPWAAAAGLVAFGWLGLCYHAPSSPHVVAAALVVWALLAVTVGDPFAAWFRLVAAVAPVHRDGEGRLRARPPCTGLSTVATTPAVQALVVVVLGSTAFDGLSRSEWWEEIQGARTGWEATAFATAGLLLAIAVVALLFRTSVEVVSRTTGDDADELSAAFAPALVPIALGFLLAHYSALVVFEGQTLLALASDPFGQGWDLFGTADRTLDTDAVPPGVVAWISSAAVVLGNLGAVVVAHDRAVERHRAAPARTMLPLTALVAVYAAAGLTLLR